MIGIPLGKIGSGVLRVVQSELKIDIVEGLEDND